MVHDDRLLLNHLESPTPQLEASVRASRPVPNVDVLLGSERPHCPAQRP